MSRLSRNRHLPKNQSGRHVAVDSREHTDSDVDDGGVNGQQKTQKRRRRGRGRGRGPKREVARSATSSLDADNLLCSVTPLTEQQYMEIIEEMYERMAALRAGKKYPPPGNGEPSLSDVECSSSSSNRKTHRKFRRTRRDIQTYLKPNGEGQGQSSSDHQQESPRSSKRKPRRRRKRDKESASPVKASQVQGGDENVQGSSDGPPRADGHAPQYISQDLRRTLDGRGFLTNVGTPSSNNGQDKNINRQGPRQSTTGQNLFIGMSGPVNNGPSYSGRVPESVMQGPHLSEPGVSPSERLHHQNRSNAVQGPTCFQGVGFPHPQQNQSELGHVPDTNGSPHRTIRRQGQQVEKGDPNTGRQKPFSQVRKHSNAKRSKTPRASDGAIDLWIQKAAAWMNTPGLGRPPVGFNSATPPLFPMCPSGPHGASHHLPVNSFPFRGHGQVVIPPWLGAGINTYHHFQQIQQHSVHPLAHAATSTVYNAYCSLHRGVKTNNKGRRRRTNNAKTTNSKSKMLVHLAGVATSPDIISVVDTSQQDGSIGPDLQLCAEAGTV